MLNVDGQSYIIKYILYYKVGQKQGFWKDLFLNYQGLAKIFEMGEYYNGLRIEKQIYSYKNRKMGGLYKKNGQKQGKWIELDERFYDNKQVTHNGEYNINGMKVGRWDIRYYQDIKKEYKQIGGGTYDPEGNQKKIGKWVELEEWFYCGQYNYKSVTYNGQYNMNGMKVGRWDILYCKYNEKKFKLLGGGSYDQDGNQKKIGKWIELDAYNQVTYNGEYNMQGIKIGNWQQNNLK